MQQSIHNVEAAHYGSFNGSKRSTALQNCVGETVCCTAFFSSLHDVSKDGFGSFGFSVLPLRTALEVYSGPCPKILPLGTVLGKCPWILLLESAPGNRPCKLSLGAALKQPSLFAVRKFACLHRLVSIKCNWRNSMK